MTPDEFIALLDVSNPRYEEFVSFITAPSRNYRFARKDSNLVEVVERFRGTGYDPVIDKRLRVVIGCAAHRLIRVELYRYHRALVPPKDSLMFAKEDHSAHADAYTDEGMGYHFSSMAHTAVLLGRRVHPIVGKKYRPDRLDKDLFRFYLGDDTP